MFRAVLLGVAVSALVAARALLPAEPPGTRPVKLTVRNIDDYVAQGCTFGVELEVNGSYSFGCSSDL